MALDGDTNSTVDRWIAYLDEVDLDDTRALEAIISRIPLALMRPIGEQRGSLIREKLLAPAIAEWERDGRIAWTGRLDRNGQKIWRVL